MDMIGAYLRFHNLYFFPVAEFSEYLSYFYLYFTVKYLPAIFWGKDYVILAIPLRMG
jgi:hypothetical protein